MNYPMLCSDLTEKIRSYNVEGIIWFSFLESLDTLGIDLLDPSVASLRDTGDPQWLPIRYIGKREIKGLLLSEYGLYRLVKHRLNTLLDRGRKLDVKEIKGSINAKKIHTYLNIKEELSEWLNRMIERYSFEENLDYFIYKETVDGKEETGYVITLDMAECLCWVKRYESEKD